MIGAALFLAACGGTSSTSGQSPEAAAPGTPTPTAVTAKTPTPATAGTLGANADACALVTSDDARSVLGDLGPVSTPTASAASGGPPTMLNGSICSYRAYQAGTMSVGVGRFSDSAAAHDGLQQLLSLVSEGSFSYPKQPVSGVGDEAISLTGPLPSPASGTGFGIGVRKGAVAFVIEGGVLTGHGPADVQGAVRALAQKVAARL